MTITQGMNGSIIKGRRLKGHNGIDRGIDNPLTPYVMDFVGRGDIILQYRNATELEDHIEENKGNFNQLHPLETLLLSIKKSKKGDEIKDIFEIEVNTKKYEKKEIPFTTPLYIFGYKDDTYDLEDRLVAIVNLAECPRRKSFKGIRGYDDDILSHYSDISNWSVEDRAFHWARASSYDSNTETEIFQKNVINPYKFGLRGYSTKQTINYPFLVLNCYNLKKSDWTPEIGRAIRSHMAFHFYLRDKFGNISQKKEDFIKLTKKVFRDKQNKSKK